MHPELIKAHLRMAGSSAAQVARSLSVSKQTVLTVMRGHTKSTRIARRICEITGLDPAKVWPGKYPEFEVNPIRRAAPAKQPAAQAA